MVKPFGCTKQFCTLQLPISYCVSLIMVTISGHIFINFFQMEHKKLAMGYTGKLCHRGKQWQLPEWQLPQWGEVDEEAFRTWWQMKIKWRHRQHCEWSRQQHVLLYVIKWQWYVFKHCGRPNHLSKCAWNLNCHCGRKTCSSTSPHYGNCHYGTSHGGIISLCMRKYELSCDTEIAKSLKTSWKNWTELL